MLERRGDRVETVDAGPALAGALAGEVPRHPGRLADAACVGGEHRDGADAERAAVRAQRRLVEGQRRGIGGVDPGAGIAADEEGPRRAGDTAGGRDEVLQPDAELGFVDARPGDRARDGEERRAWLGRRSRARGTSRRRNGRSARRAPRSRRSGSASAGRRRPTRTAAAASPSAAPGRRSGTERSPSPDRERTPPGARPPRSRSHRRTAARPARRSPRAARRPRRASAEWTMIASRAPSSRASATAPSITRCGRWRRSSLSLPLVGSPSAAFTTTTGRPRRSATARTLRRDRKACAPAAREPARLELAQQLAALELEPPVTPKVLAAAAASAASRAPRGAAAAAGAGDVDARRSHLCSRGASR